MLNLCFIGRDCSGELEVPALSAVHHTAPSDPSVPLQQSHDTAQPAQPASPTSRASGPNRQRKSSKQAHNDSGSNGAVSESTAADSLGDAAAADGDSQRGEDDAMYVESRKPNVSMLPMLRGLQAKIRSDPSVQATIKQDLPDEIKLDDTVQAVPQLCFTDKAFAKELVQAMVNSAADVQQAPGGVETSAVPLGRSKQHGGPSQKARQRAETTEAASSEAASAPPALNITPQMDNADCGQVTSQDSSEHQDLQSCSGLTTPLSEAEAQDSGRPHTQDTSQSSSADSQADARALRKNIARQLLKLKISNLHWEALEQAQGDRSHTAAFLPDVDLLQQFAAFTTEDTSQRDEISQGQPQERCQPTNDANAIQSADIDSSSQSNDNKPLPADDSVSEYQKPVKQAMGKTAKSKASAQSAPSAEHGPARTVADSDLVSKDIGDPDVTLNLTGAQVLMPDGEWKRLDTDQAGTAWTSGDCMTIGTTVAYEFSADLKQIVCVTCGWATIDAYAFSERDAIDAYIKAVGLDGLDLAMSELQ